MDTLEPNTSLRGFTWERLWAHSSEGLMLKQCVLVVIVHIGGTQSKTWLRRCKEEAKFCASFKISSLDFCSPAYGSCHVSLITLHKAENDANTIPEKLNLVVYFVLMHVIQRRADFRNQTKVSSRLSMPPLVQIFRLVSCFYQIFSLSAFEKWFLP